MAAFVGNGFSDDLCESYVFDKFCWRKHVSKWLATPYVFSDRRYLHRRRYGFGGFVGSPVNTSARLPTFKTDHFQLE